MPLFALLIAVEQYHPDSGVPPLGGCRNDVQAVRETLLSFFPDQVAEATQIKTLINEQATREGVIAAWRTHLGQAGPADTALIYFSGHGARSRTAAEFHELEPDGLEEGWVLYDSRQPGQFDLADKEIALLLAETGKTGARLVLLSDSCHSGSITRDLDAPEGWKARFTSGTDAPRPLDTYLHGAYAEQWRTAGKGQVPFVRHLALSACKHTEKAWESPNGFGIFTRALLDAVGHTGAQVSYSDLFTRLCADIRKFTGRQNPRIAAYGGFNPNEGFLGKPLPPQHERRYAVFYHPERQEWRIKLGADAGLQTDMNQEIPIEVYDAPAGGERKGTLNLYRLNVSESSFRPGAAERLLLQRTQTYWGLPLALPCDPLLVWCPDAALRQALQAILGQRSIVLTDTPAADVALRPENGGIACFELPAMRRITRTAGTADPAPLLPVLEHIAHWRRIKNLENPVATPLHRQVRFDLFLLTGGSEQRQEEPFVVLEAGRQPVDFKLTASNQSDQKLHMALVYLSPRYGMQVFAETAVSPAAPGLDRYPLLETYLHLPEGVDEERDYFKLIVSTEEIDPAAFSRDELDPDGASGGALHHTRSIGGALGRADWFAQTIEIRLVRER